jgi:hypothetical protein
MAFHGDFATGRLQAVMTHIRRFAPASSTGTRLYDSTHRATRRAVDDDSRSRIE